MQSQRHKSKGRKSSQGARTKTEEVLHIANAYIVAHFPFGCLGGTPRRLVVKNLGLWVVPVFLTSPGFGPVGEVGVVGVDDGTIEVVGSTDRHEVAKAVQHLKETKRDDLEAAFLRARTA